MTHLHWLFRQGPKEMRGLITGISLCGKLADRENLTAFPDDADCPRCLELAKEKDNA